MVQFEMYFTNEYVQEIVTDLTKAMGLHLPEEAVEKAMRESDPQSKNNLLLIKKDDRFICIDCNDRDWIFPLIVRCDENEAPLLKGIMMSWDKAIREEYAQEAVSDLSDALGKADNLLKRLEKYYDLTL